MPRATRTNVMAIANTTTNRPRQVRPQRSLRDNAPHKAERFFALAWISLPAVSCEEVIGFANAFPLESTFLTWSRGAQVVPRWLAIRLKRPPTPRGDCSRHKTIVLEATG